MPTAPPYRPRLDRSLSSDWEHMVRTHRNVDLDALLRDCGFRARPTSATPGGTPTDPPGGDRATGEPVDADWADADRTDARLADLVRAAAHDQLAARVVLQRLLPGIISMARRRSHGWGHAVHVMDELLANAWIVIRCYPIERRPVRVAANLLRDIEYQTFTRPARLRRVATEPLDTSRAGHEPPDRRHETDGQHAFTELVGLLAAARDAGLDEPSLRFAARVAGGRTLAELAEADGISERAERYRRTEVVRRLQAFALDHVVAPGAPGP